MRSTTIIQSLIANIYIKKKDPLAALLFPHLSGNIHLRWHPSHNETVQSGRHGQKAVVTVTHRWTSRWGSWQPVASSRFVRLHVDTALRRAASFRLGAERHLQLCCDCKAVWEVTGVKKEKQQEGPVLAGQVPAVNREDDLWIEAVMEAVEAPEQTEEKGTVTTALIDGGRTQNQEPQKGLGGRE